MKKLLFCAYHFPPCPSIGGALRSISFCKHLPNHGWEPEVLSCEFPEKEQVFKTKTTKLTIHRTSSALRIKRPYHLAPLGWMWPLHKLMGKLLRERKYDALYVSSPPFPPALVVAHYAKKFKVPFVLDCRDPWSHNPFASHGSLASKVLHKTLNPSFERQLFQQASQIIFTAPSTKKLYENLYPEHQDRIELICNGFDEDDFQNAKVVSPSDDSKNENTFSFVFVGELNTGGRDPSLLLEAFAEFRASILDENGSNANPPEVTLSLVGTHKGNLESEVTRLGLSNSVEITGPLPHREAIGKMLKADVLLLYNAPSRTASTPIATKTFEYLRAGKAILAIAPEGDNLDLVRQHAAHQQTLGSYRKEEIVLAMRDLYARRDELANETNPEFCAEYNRAASTAKLAAILEKLRQC